MAALSSQIAAMLEAKPAAPVRQTTFSAGSSDEPLTDLSLTSLKEIIHDNHARVADLFSVSQTSWHSIFCTPRHIARTIALASVRITCRLPPE